MNRRAFLRSASSIIGFAAIPRMLFAGQQCNTVPTITPWGVHPAQLCTAGIDSLTFVQAFQEANEWCWAACISMVFDYYDHAIDQERIVDQTWGEVVNMPGSPAAILHDLNKGWTDDGGADFQCHGDMLSVNLITAVQDLTDDHPLIIGALGHATVLTAITTSLDMLTGQWAIEQVVVRDPWPANGGRRILSPVEWANINFAARIRLTDA